MKKITGACLLALLFTAGISRAAEDSSAQQLADSVWKAAGGENWPRVQAIDFTFTVEKEGKTVVSAEHHWDVANWTDRVKWKGKEVTVNLMDPAGDEDSKAAYARWVNDSYWLLAPLKLKDKGVNLAAEESKAVDGAKREVLHLSFGQIGLTPGDQYNLYIDPQTKLVTSWDYMPEPGKTMHATWSAYEKSGGLTLATDHQMGAARIRILNLKVATR